MANAEEVEKFLKEFKQKMRIFGVLFRDDRRKNFKTLLKLELSSSKRKEILEDLQVGNYCEGPLEDSLNHSGEMWVFGKNVKKHEIYIKISMGVPNNTTICISFHIAEHTMIYKFKQS